MSYSLLLELKREVLSYLERERERARTSAKVTEAGSLLQRECAARAHEVDNILLVISGIFDQKEKALAKEGEDGKQEGRDKIPD